MGKLAILVDDYTYAAIMDGKDSPNWNGEELGDSTTRINALEFSPNSQQPIEVRVSWYLCAYCNHHLPKNQKLQRMGAEKDLTVSMLRKQWVNELQLAREITSSRPAGVELCPFSARAS